MISADQSTNTRDRLIAAMLGALRHKGFHGVGLNELLTAAKAPKGVMYYHFPGGKAELAVAAIQVAAELLQSSLDALMKKQSDPLKALAAWIASAQKVLESSGFERGCPLATIALESTADDELIRTALAEAFASIRNRLTDTLAQAGLPTTKARSHAALIVSAYEGALLQARVAGNTESIRDTGDALIELLTLTLTRQKEQP